MADIPSERPITDGTAEAALNNLRALDDELVRLGERRDAHLADLCRALLAGGAELIPPDDDTFRTRYGELMRGGHTLPSDVLAENRNAAIERLTVLSSAERAQFCRAVAKAAYDTDGKSIVDMLCMQDTSDTHSRFADAYDEYDEYDGYDDDDGDERNKTDAGRISYLRNYYADAAYTVFASVIDEPTVMYNSDFAGVCEDVYYGRAGCCILPVESSSDGRLASFRTLIRKYELKTALTCTVETGDSSSTKFALLKKRIERPNCPEKRRGSSYFEFDVTLSDLSALSGLLGAAHLNGLGLARIDSLPASYTQSGYSYAMSFKCDGGFLDGFLCYLYMEDPRFTPVGLFCEVV